jgi:hypothetical protein
MMKMAVVFLLSFVVGCLGMGAYQSYTDVHGDGTEKEFVCYTHDKLTERHVGVASAHHSERSDNFHIYYVEGNSVYYTPKPGESCAVEEIR